MIEKTLVILKPCTFQRGLAGEITHLFERKGLQSAGIRTMQLTDELLSEHHAYLSSRPFFQRVKGSMMITPTIICCYEGVDTTQAARILMGPTNGRLATSGVIYGDYSMSFQENIAHTSDSPETAAIELTGLFRPEEIFDYRQVTLDYLYANDEYQLN